MMRSGTLSCFGSSSIKYLDQRQANWRFTPRLVRVKLIVESITPGVLSGLHLGVFVFGQSSAGKSYSIHGTIGNEGIIVRMLRDLYFSIAVMEKEGNEVKVFLSAYDVYNEQGTTTSNNLVNDLFNSRYERNNVRGLKRDGTFEVCRLFNHQIEPPLTQVRCPTVHSAIENLDRIHGFRKQMATIKKRKKGDASYILKYSVQIIEPGTTNGVIEGSLTIVDVAKMEDCVFEEDVGEGCQNDKTMLERASVTYVHKSLEYCLGSRNMYQSPNPNGEGSEELVSRLVSDCFGERGRCLVLLNLSPFKADIKETVACCEFGKAVMTSNKA